MRDFFVCPICGNEDEKYIGYLNGRPYCRKCISFKGEIAKNSFKVPQKANYKLNYSLSGDQKAISLKLIENYKEGKNSFIHAVCGSGKTEIVLGIISYAIQCGDKVGFAVPRKDVVIELYQRFKEIFKNNKLCLLYGGHHKVLNADIVCLTTHQLYRYENYFDLLIMDEVDAFPYKGSDVLYKFFERSLKGKYVLMSATASPEMLEQFKKDDAEILELFTRFHKHPLPVPENIIHDKLLLPYYLMKILKSFLKEKKPVFIFTPTIEMCEETFKFLHLFFKSGKCVHSKKTDRQEIIESFRKNEVFYLVTTAVLERGVTVKDLQVIVYHAEHKIYDEYSLIQIAGRAGRKKEAPEGKVIFIADKITESMQNCINEITNANESLQKML